MFSVKMLLGCFCEVGSGVEILMYNLHDINSLSMAVVFNIPKTIHKE